MRIDMLDYFIMRLLQFNVIIVLVSIEEEVYWMSLPEPPKEEEI